MNENQWVIEGFEVERSNSKFKIQIGKVLVKTVKSFRDVFIFISSSEAENWKVKVNAKNTQKQKLMKLK